MTAIELRILGCLVEKERTTPDQYPLTTNSLVLACNQKTNREPVSSYIEHEVETCLQNLRDKGLVQTTRAANERVYKHQHKLDNVLGVSSRSLALLAVLMLRGKQTPGELRTRTERYTHFASLDEVEAELEKLAQQQPPLAKNFGRGPGQSQNRWGQLLGGDEEKQRPRARPVGARASTVEALEAELTELKDKVAFLYEHLGLDPDEAELADFPD